VKIKNYFIVLALVLLASLTFGSILYAEEIELKIWFGRENFIPGDRFETFLKENPNIKVSIDVVPLEVATSEYVRAVRAGKAPDIIQLLLPEVKFLAEEGLLMNLNSMFSNWERDEPERFNELTSVAFNMAKANGEPYGLALHAMPYLYVYRSDLLKKSGISKPETWEDVLLTAKKVKEDQGVLGFSIIGGRENPPEWFLTIFDTMGGSYNNSVPQLDSEAGRNVLKFYQSLMKDNLAHKDTLAWASGEMRAAFAGGRAAQALITISLYPSINEDLKYGEEWMASAPPYREGAKEEWKLRGSAWPYVVNSKTLHAEAVEKVLKYLSRAEIVGEVSKRYVTATNKKVFSDPDYLAVQPWWEDILDAYANMGAALSHSKIHEQNEILKDAYQEALANPNADVNAMAKKYQEELDKLFN